MKISQLMNNTVATCNPDATLGQAARLMWDRDVGCVAVLDAKQKPVGMITDRDIAMSAMHSGKPLTQIYVKDVMSKDLVFCSPNDTIQAAEERMSKRQVRRLPVVEGDKLVGIISMNDLARASASQVKKPDSVEFKEVAQTLAAICQPRPRPATYRA